MQHDFGGVSGYYWLLYALSGLLLIYSLTMCIIKKPVSRKLTVGVRRIYYSVYFFGVVIMFDYLGDDSVKLIGKNKLGISEELCFFLIALFIGFILDILVISAMSFKEIAFGSTKIQIAEDDLVQHVKSQVDLTNDLTKKIISHYNMIQNLGKYVDPLVSRIKEGTVDILKEYQEFLGAYFSYQKEHESELEERLYIDIIELNETVMKNEYKTSSKEYKRLKEQIEANQTYFLQKGKTQYMFIPYRSVLLEYNTILIVMHSKKSMVKVEQYIIISLLQQLEERLIYQFQQQNRLVRKNSRYYYKKKK
ncbi:MAG: hypothetical protein N3I35_13240 [Clostridia bacterium]|nr:hypothetical protein [Clostridia bacterium]